MKTKQILNALLFKKTLTKGEMKKIKGGTGSPANVCGDPRRDYPCAIYLNGGSIVGECGSINGRCKCITPMGDYQTANDHYSCEDTLPTAVIQP